jgi:hypothetical protein
VPASCCSQAPLLALLAALSEAEPDTREELDTEALTELLRLAEAELLREPKEAAEASADALLPEEELAQELALLQTLAVGQPLLLRDRPAEALEEADAVLREEAPALAELWLLLRGLPEVSRLPCPEGEPLALADAEELTLTELLSLGKLLQRELGLRAALPLEEEEGLGLTEELLLTAALPLLLPEAAELLVPEVLPEGELLLVTEGLPEELRVELAERLPPELPDAPGEPELCRVEREEGAPALEAEALTVADPAALWLREKEALLHAERAAEPDWAALLVPQELAAGDKL